MTKPDEKPDRDMVQLATYWKTQLEAAKKSDEDFITNGERTVARYKDERKNDKGRSKYNILWSNTQTILPAVYSRTPKAEAKRRNDDADPVARTAAALIERALQYELDVFADFSEAMNACVTDWLLPGRGTAWVRFESDEDGSNARSCVDYVYWKDFRHSPARIWGDVDWVAKRTYVSRKEGVKRWGSHFNKVPLTFEPIGLPEMRERTSREAETEAMKKAQIWEIWDKTDGEVVWIAEGYPKALDVQDDPYELDEFFPTPKPLFATQTTDTLAPVADFIFYRDQAIELDQITTKIDQLTHALKVVGMYDAANNDLKNLLSSTVNNQMVPVQTWAAFAERGGIGGAVQFLPLAEVVAALQQLYVAREQVKAVIYEITGISDIIRGASDAQETATAQNIKRQFGSLRLKPRQHAVAVFASEILRIKAQLMMDKYSDAQLVEMSDMQIPPADPMPQIAQPGMPPQPPMQPGAQAMPQPAEGDAQFIPQALALIKQEPMRVYRIQVDADSLVEVDEEQEKQQRTEFLAAAGQYLNQVLPLAKEVPQLVPLLSEMLMFGVRAYKAAEPIEQAFQSAMDALRQPQPPKPDPEMAKVQAQAQQAQQQMQMDAQKAQMQAQVDSQIAQMKAQTEAQIEQARASADMEVQRVKIQSQNELEQARTQMQMQLEQYKHETQLAHQGQLEASKMAFERWKAELEAATKIEVANISSKAKMQDAATDTATKEIASEVTQ